jgi:hypothetical protein
VTPPSCPCGQPCARVMGGSYQRLCQACIAALPRPGAASAPTPGALARRKRRAEREAVCVRDTYTVGLAAIDNQEAAWLRLEERRRR